MTKNDQTVTEAYVVDETVALDPSSTTPYPGSISPALKKAVDIGVLCNNASLARNEDGVYVGQATDVALLNVLDVFGLPDRRSVSLPFSCRVYVNLMDMTQRRALNGYRSDLSTLSRSLWLSAESTAMVNRV